jgi:hypothetical protein
MRRVLTLPAVIVATAMVAWAAEETGKDNSDESFDIEPPLLIQNRPGETLSGPGTNTTPAGDVDPVRLEKQLERARKNAAGAERLYKIGVLARVEVEQRALKIVRLESDLANARLAQAKEESALQESRFTAGEISKADCAQAETALALAIETAHTAAANLERAQLEAAELNLQRQQKLLALGSARKSDVNRAQEKLAQLRTPKD